MPTDFPDNAVRVQHTIVEELTAQVGGPSEATTLVLRDQGPFDAFWTEATSARRPAPTRPDIDFDTEMVLVAAMGTRMTAGHTIGIEGVYETPEAMWIDVLEVSPGAGCMLAQMITAPVVAVRVSRTERAVEFVRRTDVRDCG